MEQNNFLDSLFTALEDEELNISNNISNTVIIPKRCANCKTSIVCSILHTFIDLSKIKILISLEQCPFYQTKKANGKSQLI